MARDLFLRGLKPHTQHWVALQRPQTFDEVCKLADSADASLMLQRNLAGLGANSSGASRNNQGQFQRSYQRPPDRYRGVPHNRISQYSNSKYKGPAPMVLGAAQTRQVGPCHNCGKMGHLKKDCWALHGRPGNAGGNKRAPPPPPPKN